MSNLSSENLFICEKCGQPYLNFCVSCAKARREEQVEELMDQHGLTVERLITELTEHVLADRNFAALKTAIELKSMKPATKTDVTSGGQPILVDDAVKQRIANKINQLIRQKSDSTAD